ncbi:unnamed protein product [Parascedosporium putredinis]|uniref:protein-L-isoaspartate(D-aspartate) O-methyltransferase n=1 Tax=Parascedosporium putredinis TaxID=1442378 RepID=A0A9P1M7V9_9PEZI|nr:unnamed protein product [Parascedosporium putredinis]CAI7988983.1 unnamed protein product [Parascedosporium putredinis]
MAWRSTGTSNEELVENMWRNKLMTDSRVKSVFLKVDRAHYAPAKAYVDAPQTIGYGATISAPHMHATAIENLVEYIVPKPDRPAPRVLDVGSGSGYLTHLMAELVGEKGLVIGVKFTVGDGRKGWVEPPREGEDEGGQGWDAIHVGASAKEVHAELLAQLKSPGRMFIPVDDDSDGWNQHVWNIDKDKDGNVTKHKLFGVRYVPLTDAPKDR